MAALLDSLTALDPLTLQPAAALATHYEVDSRGTRYTFYLRGHPNPRGIRLPNTDYLPQEFSREHRAPADRSPARWSDGTSVTAHDFVYSWRRFVDPATGAWAAFYLAPLRNAEEIAKGLNSSDKLSVRAVDDFTFQFDLVAPMPSFPETPLAALSGRGSTAVHRSRTATGTGVFVDGARPLRLERAVPTAGMEAQRSSRADQESAVLGSAIRGNRGDRLSADLERDDECQSLQGWCDAINESAAHSSAVRAGPPEEEGLWHIAAPSGRSRTRSTLTKPPLDRLPVRYALNLATDKAAIATFLGAGQKPAQWSSSADAGLSFAASVARFDRAAGS